MNKNLTLVILAAGMGSRFGGLKQIEPVGPNNEFIIDYSIYDAINVGFQKIIFVIKRENYEVFKNTIGKRIAFSGKIKVCYAFQEIDDLPNGCSYDLPLERTKPWGTAHAIYAARKFIDGNFAIINADDFYGYDAFKKLAEFLNNNNTKDNKDHYCIIGYKAINTMTLNGSVKRGVLEVKNNFLTNIIESKIEKINDKIIAKPLDGRDEFLIDNNSLVSMNMIGFNKNIINEIEEGFPLFLDKNKDNLLTCEYLIPDVIFDEVKESNAIVSIIKTSSIWYGVTYKEDKEIVVNAINKLIEEGTYPKKLF